MKSKLLRVFNGHTDGDEKRDIKKDENVDRIYKGIRNLETKEITIFTPTGAALELAPSFKLFSHSPDGFEWGYNGSGSAQLALAILLDFTSNPMLAFKWHQDFKWQFIVPALHDSFVIKEEEIRTWLNKKTGVTFF